MDSWGGESLDDAEASCQETAAFASGEFGRPCAMRDSVFVVVVVRFGFHADERHAPKYRLVLRGRKRDC